MANLQIKNVPEELYDEAKRRARREGITLREYLLRLIRQDHELVSKSEWLERMRYREPVHLDATAYARMDDDKRRRDGEPD